jgi:hypothetical protein
LSEVVPFGFAVGGFGAGLVAVADFAGGEVGGFVAGLLSLARGRATRSGSGFGGARLKPQRSATSSA